MLVHNIKFGMNIKFEAVDAYCDDAWDKYAEPFYISISSSVSGSSTSVDPPYSSGSWFFGVDAVLLLLVLAALDALGASAQISSSLSSPLSFLSRKKLLVEISETWWVKAITSKW